MGFAAGGELGGLTVEARQFGLEMQMAKIEVAENPAAYISLCRQSRLWTGVLSAPIVISSVTLWFPGWRRAHHRETQGITGRGSSGKTDAER